MANNTIGTRIKMDGAKESREQISQLNASFRQMNAEMKKLQEAYKGQEKSTTLLVEKDRLLSRQKEVQVKKIEELKKALAIAKELYGENSKKVQGYQKSLTEAETSLVKLNNEIEANKSQLQNTARIYNENAKTIEELAVKQAEAERTFGKGSKEVKQYSDEIKRLQEDQKKLIGEMNVEKLKEMNSQYAVNKEKLVTLNAQYEESVKVFGKTSEEAQKYKKQIEEIEKEQVQLNNALKTEELRKMSSQYTVNKDKISDLRKEYRQVKRELGENSEKAKELKTKLNNLESTQKTLKSSMNKCSKEIDSQKKSIDGLGDETKNTEKEIKIFGQVLLANLTGKAISSGLNSLKNGIKDFSQYVVGLGSDFKYSMSNVAATMGLTAEEINKTGSEGQKTYKALEDAAKKWGAETQFSASQSADALNYMALAGYNTNQAISTLPHVLDLAAAGAYDLGTASDQLTDMLTALGHDVNYAETMVDQMAKTSQKSNTTVQDLGSAILVVGGTAKNMAGGTAELCTAIGVLSDNGIHGAESGTKLRNVLLALNPTTKDQIESWKMLGISAYDAQGKLRPLQDTFKDLNEATKDMTQQERTDLLSKMFNKQDLKAVEALLGSTGGRLDELNGYINNSTGAAKEMAKTLNDNLKGKMEELSSATEGVGISLFEKFDNPLQTVVEHATEGISAIEQQVTGNTAISDALDKAGQSVEELGIALVDGIINVMPNLLKSASTVITTITNLGKGIADAGSFFTKTMGYTDNFGESLARLAFTVTSVVIAVKTYQTAMKAMELVKKASEATKFSTALLKVTGVTKIATATQVAFNAICSANPLVLIAGVLLSAVGAYVGYNKMLDITGGKTAELSKETAELLDSVNDLKEEASSVQINYQTSTDDLLAQNSAMGKMVDTLFELRNAENQTAESKAQQKAIIDKLNEAYPELNLSLNEEKNTLNMAEDAIRSYMSQAMEQAKLSAIQDSITESYKRQYEAQANLKRAKENKIELDKKEKEAEEKLADAQHNTGLSYSKNRKRYEEAKNSLAEVRAEQKANNEIMAKSNETIKTEGENIDFLGREMEGTTQAMSDNTEATKENATATEQNNEKKKEAIKITEEEQESYLELADSIKKSVESAISSFDALDNKSKHSKEELIKNMQNNAKVAQRWGEDLSSIAKRTSADFASYLRDMGITASGEVKLIASMSDKELQKYFKSWQKAYGKVPDIVETVFNATTGITLEGVQNGERIVANGEKKKANEVKKGGKSQESAVKKTEDNKNRTIKEGSDKQVKTVKNGNQAMTEEVSKNSKRIHGIAKNTVTQTASEYEKLAPKTKNAGKKAIDSLAGGMIDGKPAVKKATNAITDTQTEGMKKGNRQATKDGEKYTENIASGMENKKGKTVQSLESIGREMAQKNQSMYIRGGELGRFLMEGFAKGISRNSFLAENKISAICESIVATAKKKLDIHSPSRVMQQIGKFVTQGVAVGIISEQKKVKEATTEIVKTVTSEAKKMKINPITTDVKFKGILSEIKTVDKADSKVDSAKTKKEKTKAIKERQKAEKDLIDNAALNLRKVKLLKNLSLREEISYWNELLKHLNKNSSQYKKVSSNILKLKEKQKDQIKKIDDQFLSNAEKTLQRYADRHNVSAADEKAYWEKMLSVTSKSSENYSKIKEKIYEADLSLYNRQKEIQQKMVSAKKEYQQKIADINTNLVNAIHDVEQSYKDSVKSTQESIQSALGLFEKFDSSTEQTSQSLITNMHSQVLALGEYIKTMDSLRRRGVSQALLDDLEKAGVKDLATIKKIAEMNDKQLKEYDALYQARNKLAGMEATKEVNVADYQAQYENLRQEATNQAVQLKKQLKADLADMNKELENLYQAKDKTLAKKATSLVEKYCKTVYDKTKEKKVINELASLGETIVKQSDKTKEMEELGKKMVEAVINGMNSKKSILENTISDITDRVPSSQGDSYKMTVKSYAPTNKTGQQKDLSSAIKGIQEAVLKSATTTAKNGLSSSDIAKIDSANSMNAKIKASVTNANSGVISAISKLNSSLTSQLEKNRKAYESLELRMNSRELGRVVSKEVSKISKGK